MSFYESEEYLASDEVELSAEERGGHILLPGRVVFADLAEMGQVDDYAPRYQITFLVPKGHEAVSKLVAVCESIGQKTWGGEAESRMAAVWDCVDKGVAPRNSNISFQDGDLHQPEYNSGNWWVKASRREDEGRPLVFDQGGEYVFAPNQLDPDTGEIANGELIGDESQIPQQGTLAVISMRVWAQKRRERINFSVVGVRYAGKAKGSSRAIAAQEQVAGQLGSAEAVASLGAGFEQADSAPAKVPAKAGRKAAKKKPAKKSPAKKKTGSSVFKKRG